MAFNCKDALVIIIENVIVNVCDFKHLWHVLWYVLVFEVTGILLVFKDVLK